MKCPKCRKGRIRVDLGILRPIVQLLGARDPRYAFCDSCGAHFAMECSDAPRRKPCVFIPPKPLTPFFSRAMTNASRQSMRESPRFMIAMKKRSLLLETYLKKPSRRFIERRAF